MLNFRVVRNRAAREEYIETSLAGKLLLTIPQLNKGTAFSEEERHTFGLLGKLPAYVETLDEQVARAYLQFQSYTTDRQKNIYLNSLHDKNHVLFYKLLSQHLTEMMPIIYTPIVGVAVKEFSREFRQARGLYIAHTYRDEIESILDNRSHPEVDLIVVTDGESVLGIGDQGIGAIDIPIAKLMVYTLCAGINPLRTLPIMLDVGTNNQTLLDDPLYLGLRHPRIHGEDYDDFMEKFINAVKRKFPRAFLHYEDFGRNNAYRNLERFRDQICSFNDDIQGTGVVTLAALLAAVKATNSRLSDQRIIIYGAGAAGTGIAEQICAAMKLEGLTEEEARKRFWLLDRNGLLLEDSATLIKAQTPFARSRTEIANWKKEANGTASLLEVIKEIHPTVLIGCSTKGGAFDKTIVQTMAQHVEHPIIFPLSNPTENAEAHPADLLEWTDGKALIATGSPFGTINYRGREVVIAQCNNALAFPGLGLGVLAIQASRVSDEMLWIACQTLANHAPVLQDKHSPLLPSMADARAVAREIGIAVVIQAQREALAQVNDNGDVAELIDYLMWTPRYLPFKKIE